MPKRKDQPTTPQAQRQAGRTANAARRRRRRRYNYILYYILLLLFAVAVGVVLSLTVFFKTEQVRVTGQSIYTEYQLVRRSGISLGENLFLADTRAIEERLSEAYPFLESVEVTRRIPATLVIHVQPATPSGALRNGESYLLFNREGRVLQTDSRVLPQGCYLVEGISPEGLQPNRNLKETAEEQLVLLGSLLEAVERQGFGGITAIDLSDTLNLKLIYQQRIVVELGSEAELDYKLNFARHTLEEKIGAQEQGTMTVSAANKRITFRPQNLFGGGEEGLQAPGTVWEEPPQEEGEDLSSEPEESSAQPGG